MIDSTPIVVIAGQVGTNFLGTDAFQEVDLVGITQPITKWSYQIRRAEDVPWAVARAFYVAKSGRPGPVVLYWILLKTPKWRKQNMRLLRWTMSVAIFPFPKWSRRGNARRLLN